MRAGESACSCPQCGVVCRGRFAGCAEVWARGPREVHVVSPPNALARRTPTPARANYAPAEQHSGADQARTEVLAWLQAAFDGLRDELSVLAGSLARQQAVLSDISENRDSEVATALAEVKDWAAELRNETLRLQGFERAVADQLRADVSATISQGVDQIATTRNDDVRQALAQVEERAAALREETDRLQDFGQNLAEQLRTEVAKTVQDGMASLMAAAAAKTESTEPAPAPDALAAQAPSPDLAAELRQETERLQRFGETLADSVRDAVTSALQNAQLTTPATTPEIAAAAPAPAVAPVSVPEPAPAEVAPVAEPAAAGASKKTPSSSSGAPSVPAALELPSGALVGPTLATAAVDALTLARVARRRRRIPATPAAGLHRADPLLTDMLRRLERFALGRRTGTTARARTAEATGRWGIDALPVAAAGDTEVAVDLRELNGLALTGAGAVGVARAMAVTFFCRHRRPAEVVLVGDELLPGTPGVPGLSRVTTVDGALVNLGIVADDNDLDGDEVEPRPSHRTPAAHLAFVSGMTDADVERLRQSVDQRPELGVTVVIVGSRAAASATVDVDDSGMPVSAEPSAWADRFGEARMLSLQPAEAAELVALADASRREGDDLLAAELNGEVCNVTEIVGRSATRTAPLIDVRMLGSFRIEVGDEEIRGGLRTKARELLAFHLLHPEGASLDAAVEALWPEADAGRGSEWFWTALGNLRSRLRTACGIKDMKIIDRVGDTYRLEVERFGVDVWRFEEALAASSPGMGDAMPSTEALERAVAEYGGELLTGDPWQWVEGAREDVRRRALDAVAHLAERKMEAGDLDGALSTLEHGLEIDAISEELYRRTMDIQGQLSRRDAIRGTFRLLQARLAAYGLTPDPSTEKVFGDLVARA